MAILKGSLDASFQAIHKRSVEIISSTSDDELYRSPRVTTDISSLLTIGENILRSAAAVEQTFGGITVKLWDDPFEWTLPEQLNTSKLVIDYLNEVDLTRQNGFKFISTDAELHKSIPGPIRLISIIELLNTALVRAAYWQGRASAVHQVLCGGRVHRP
ncbi:MAG: hypothetical protein ABI539_08255 [Acidobacteriota bacterium]